MPCTLWSYKPSSEYKSNLMEKRWFRHQSRPLPRKGQTSWPRNEGVDFWQQERLRNRFLPQLRLKVTNRLNWVNLPFDAHLLNQGFQLMLTPRDDQWIAASKKGTWLIVVSLNLNSVLWRASCVICNIDVTTFWFKIYAHNKMRFTILGSGMTPKCFSLVILRWLYVNFLKVIETGEHLCEIDIYHTSTSQTAVHGLKHQWFQYCPS